MLRNFTMTIYGIIHQVLCNWGMTLKQSSSVHLLSSVSADGILPGFCWLTSAFSYKFSFSSGRTVGQFPNCTKPRTLAAMLQRQSANAGSSIDVVPQFINRLTKQIFISLTCLYFDNGTSAGQKNFA